jgi:hypothetical protein
MKSKAIPVNLRHKVSAALYEISKQRYDRVPLDAIDKALRIGHLQMVQEDGTPWSGLISLPREKNVTIQIDLYYHDPDPKSLGYLSKSRLILNLYRFNSGRIEVNAYVS